MDLTLLCDMRIMADNAKLAAVTAKRYVIPELYYRGRIIGAQESIEIGIVNEVVAKEDLMSTAMQTTKRVMRMGWKSLMIRQ